VTASLLFYRFADVDWAYRELWRAVRRRAPWLPQEMTLDGEPHARCREPGLHLAQTCGWPLVTDLRESVRVVGSFVPSIPAAAGATYHSLVVARRPVAPRELRGARAAVNEYHSLSGWVSLVWAVHGPGAEWHGPVLSTGSHRASVVALAAGRADVASIDAVSWAHLCRVEPDATSLLTVVGHGPQVPTLPLVTRRDVPPRDLAELRRALTEAATDPSIADALGALFIAGFVAREFEDYLPILSLAPRDPRTHASAMAGLRPTARATTPLGLAPLAPARP
jgi:ABC-type phosphate/phosphonate transport system substrate-binding protein